LVGVDWAGIGAKGAPLSSYARFGSAALPGTSFPSVLMVDSGTTNVLLPDCGVAGGGAATSAAISAVSPSMQVIIALKPAVPGGQPVYITYGPADVTFGYDGASPVFVAMDAGTAANFSSAATVGILGCTGMRNLYVEFNLTRSLIGFAQLASP
jgi:hypothetical protein